MAIAATLILLSPDTTEPVIVCPEVRHESTQHDLKRFSKIDDRLAALIILADYLTVASIAVLAIWAHNIFATLMTIALIAGRQVAFLNLVHAAAHRSLFSKRKTNDRVDLIVSYPIFDAVRPYRVYHLEHHREIARKEPYRFDYIYDQLPDPGSSLRQRIWIMVIKPLLGAAGIDYIKATIEQCRETSGLTWKLAAYWTVIAGVFFWAGWLKYLLLYWFVPLIWLYPVFYSWAEISDHHAVKDEARNQRGLFYALFIKGHEMYHAVHHLYPRIPFYRIKAANKYLNSSGQKIEETRGIIDLFSILHRTAPRGPSASL